MAPESDAPARHRALPVGFVTTCRKLLIIGGGIDAVSRTRHATLFDWHAVRILLPEKNPAVEKIVASDPRMEVLLRPVTEDDIRWADFVVKDSGDFADVDQIAGWCRAHGKLLNAVDKAELCDIFYASLLTRGPLVVGITSGGQAPALSSALRRHLELELGAGWAKAAEMMASLRQRLPRGHARVDLLRKLGRNSDLLDCILRDDEVGLKKILDDALSELRT